MALLPHGEQVRLQKMLEAAGRNQSITAETVFGLSAIAGCSIAIDLRAKKQELKKKVASKN